MNRSTDWDDKVEEVEEEETERWGDVFVEVEVGGLEKGLSHCVKDFIH